MTTINEDTLHYQIVPDPESVPAHFTVGDHAPLTVTLSRSNALLLILSYPMGREIAYLARIIEYNVLQASSSLWNHDPSLTFGESDSRAEVHSLWGVRFWVGRPRDAAVSTPQKTLRTVPTPRVAGRVLTDYHSTAMFIVYASHSWQYSILLNSAPNAWIRD